MQCNENIRRVETWPFVNRTMRNIIMAGGKDKVQQQKKDNLYRIQLSQFYKLASFTITLSRAAELWGKSLRLKIIFSPRHRRLSSSGRCCLVRTKKHFFGKTQNFKAEIDTFPQFSSSLLSQLKVHSHCHDGRAFWLSPWNPWHGPTLDSIWTGCRENWAEMRELPCKQMYSYLPSSAFDMRVNLTSE